MGKIATAMQVWLKYYRGTRGHEALKYIETGDPAALARIGPNPQIWEPWIFNLPGVMTSPAAMGDEDRRALHALAAAGSFDQIGGWLSKAIGRSAGNEDLFDRVRDELATVNVPAEQVSGMAVAYIHELARKGRPTSAGRHLLALSDPDLEVAVKQSGSQKGHVRGNIGPHLYLADFLLDLAPERLGPLIPVMTMTPGLCDLILRKGADRYEPAVVAAWRKMKEPSERFMVGEFVAAYDRERYGREVLENARDVLARELQYHQWTPTAVWMIQHYGAEVIDELAACLDRIARVEGYAHQSFLSAIVDAAVKALGPRALPVVLAGMKTCEVSRHLEVLGHWIEIDDGSHEALIQSELERHLTGESVPDGQGHRGQSGVPAALAPAGVLLSLSGVNSPSQHLVSAINLAARWRPAMVADRLWELMGHKSKSVSAAAARALAPLGASVVPRAAGMLEDRKADRRAAAVILLTRVGTSEALQVLEQRLDNEPDDDIRDAILLALDAAQAAAGGTVTRAAIDRRIERAAPKLRAPAAAWIDEARLPPLQDGDGQPLGPEAVRYLLYRQSRAREIQPDVEARPLYALIDRSTSGDFALEVLRQFMATKADAKDRWALAVAGLLGDGRLVPVFNRLIDAWAESSRGKMAEYAVQALALLGTDAALMSLDAAANRFHTKNKNIGTAAREAFAAAAERLGLTVDELGDRVVPWLGFEPGRPRVVGAEGKQFEASIGPDFKLKYRDLQKNKVVTSLPKSLPKEILDEFKQMAATLREVAKAQKLRLEALMVAQFRWPVARWRELFLEHPVLFVPFATRLVWGHYDTDGSGPRGTFRALEDRTLTDASDNPFELSDTGAVGIIHPLELNDEALAAWRTHLADYEVASPFPQLERPIVRVSDKDRAIKISGQVTGTSLNALTFRGRAEKLGWGRGSVTDGGGVDTYRKVFPAAGVEAFLGLEGFFMGAGMNDSLQLGQVYFVRAGSVRVGSYIYDDPADETDARLIAFGDVPPVVYSEVMGNLKRIAGQAAEEPDEEG